MRWDDRKFTAAVPIKPATGGRRRWLLAGRFGPWFVLTGLLMLSGCQLVGREGPVPKSVASCRQMSQRGISAMDHGQWDNAEALLAQAVKTCPADAEARRNYAETLWHRGALAEAVAQLEEAIRISGEDAALQVRVGEMNLAMGRVAEALRRADQAIDLSPQSATAWALRGRANAAAGQLELALVDYQRALGIQHDNAKVLLETAELYRRLDRPQRALSTLECLVDTYPAGEEPPQVLYLQGLALVALNRYPDAVESYQAAAERPNPTPELLFRLSEAQMLAGRTTDAQRTLERALAQDPNYAPSRALAQRLDLAQRTVRQ